MKMDIPNEKIWTKLGYSTVWLKPPWSVCSGHHSLRSVGVTLVYDTAWDKICTKTWLWQNRRLPSVPFKTICLLLVLNLKFSLSERSPRSSPFWTALTKLLSTMMYEVTGVNQVFWRIMLVQAPGDISGQIHYMWEYMLRYMFQLFIFPEMGRCKN